MHYKSLSELLCKLCGPFLQNDPVNISRYHLLWYPSSGSDLYDILFFNTLFLPEIGVSPNFFVHTDHFSLHDRHFITKYTCFKNLEERQIQINDHSALLYKFEHFGESKFLLKINEIDNGDFFGWVTRPSSSVKFDYMYTACDGVTSGMQVGDWSVSSLFYTKYYTHLGIQFHVTEYSKQGQEIIGILDTITQQNAIKRLLLEHPHIQAINAEKYPACIIGRDELPILSFRSISSDSLYLRDCRIG